MHSGLLIFVWVFSVALLQFVPLVSLMVLLACLGLAGLMLAHARTRRLVLRIRILLFAIFVMFAWFTPGTAVFMDWPTISPSREGLLLAFEHSGRVLAVVLCVALLMQTLPPARLVGGIYALLRVFESVGLPSARIAVRTLLVLQYVESDRPVNWRDWLRDPGNDPQAPVDIPIEPLRVLDAVILVTSVAIFVLLGVWL